MTIKIWRLKIYASSSTIKIGMSILLLCSGSYTKGQDKKALENQYKNKFVVVIKEGLAVGVCAERASSVFPNDPSKPLLAITIRSGTAEYNLQRSSTRSYGCNGVAPEPIHKGEVLKVEWLRLGRIAFQGKLCSLQIMNVSPHAIERGVGAFAHQSNERGEAEITFKLDAADELSQASSLLNDWFKVFDTQDEAVAFGNTASGVFVKQIKAGMTITEVEAVLGTPQTRIDLTDKVLYKYKDMTIEFREGKVADVR